MDLNQSYFQRQRSLILARAAKSASARKSHLATAGQLARTIASFQSAAGARAAGDWNQTGLAGPDAHQPLPGLSS